MDWGRIFCIGAYETPTDAIGCLTCTQQGILSTHLPFVLGCNIYFDYHYPTGKTIAEWCHICRICKVLFLYLESSPIKLPPPQEKNYSTVAYANLNMMISTSELSNVSLRLFKKRVLHAKLDTYVVVKRHRQLYCTYVLHMDRSILHITYFTVNARDNM